MSNASTARQLVGNILANLPHNRNRHFAALDLKNAGCKLYLPLSDTQVSNEKRVKDMFQDIFDKAEF